MTLTAGARIGPYEILSHAGAGGMGEVWKARDTRLNRAVAIKTSDKQFSDRFEREARAIAALNHPHICAIYDVGQDYLVMEFVEGEPIKGPLPLAKALDYAKQILEALHAAHRAGIVHRDLKPANILVGKSGVKVLDFGLAKMEQAIASNDEATLVEPITQEGTIAGTLQYMAPEQLQGRQVDSRADLFAFGCVLYEMLTGKRAFDGANAASVIAAILERQAPSVASIAPPVLDHVLKRCLAKDPEERWQSALDVKAELEWAGRGLEANEAAPAFARRRIWPLLTAAIALAIGLAAVSFVHFREKPAEAPLLRASIVPADNAKFDPRYGPVAISPDGSRIAFISDSGGAHRIWVRPLESTSAFPLAGTEEALPRPFWSPDGSSVGFVAAGGKLGVVDTSGRAPRILANGQAVFAGAVWMRNGTIVYGSHGNLHTVNSSGGPISDLVLRGAPKAPVDSVVDGALPDGNHFLYLTDAGNGREDLRAGSIDARDSRFIEQLESTALYSKGYLLWLRGTTLVAQPFNEKTLEVTGGAFPIGQDFASASVSASGLLAYFSGSAGLELALVDRRGARASDVSEAAIRVGRIQLSPDGSRLITYLRESAGYDLWIYDIARRIRIPSRFTFDGSSIDGVWSPDGKTIVFMSFAPGRYALYRKPADNSASKQLLYEDAAEKFPMSWSPDGKFLLYLGAGSLWILPDPLGSHGKPFVFAHEDKFAIQQGRFSPDGHWVSYQSNESGRNEIYVQPFPGPGPKIQISTGGGTYARWRRDGKEIFYIDPDMKLMSVPIRMNGTDLEPGRAQPLFEGISPGPGFPYDVMPDGQHFVILTLAGKGIDANLNIIQNWPAMLKRNN